MVFSIFRKCRFEYEISTKTLKISFNGCRSDVKWRFRVNFQQFSSCEWIRLGHKRNENTMAVPGCTEEGKNSEKKECVATPVSEILNYRVVSAETQRLNVEQFICIIRV